MCKLRSKPEKYGLYTGEFHCETHQGYTINGECPRENETYDLSKPEDLAKIIDPYAWPTKEQIEIRSVCYTGWPVEQMFMRCEMDYQVRQRFALEAAKRVLQFRSHY